MRKLPLILKPEGKGKLSKRDGDKHGFPVFPIEWADKAENTVSKGYREEGYEPQALVNMLLLLGWNGGTEQEIYSLEEMIADFSIERISKSGARFNPEKATWFNHTYLQKKEIGLLTADFEKILTQNNIVSENAYNQKVVALLRERANFPKDLWTQGTFFYQTPSVFVEKDVAKAWKEDTASLIKSIIEIVEKEDFSKNTLEENIKSWITAQALGFGKVMQPLRLALVGSLQGPDIFVLMQMIGKQEVLVRLGNAIAKFG